MIGVVEFAVAVQACCGPTPRNLRKDDARLAKLQSQTRGDRATFQYSGRGLLKAEIAKPTEGHQHEDTGDG